MYYTKVVAIKDVIVAIGKSRENQGPLILVVSMDGQLELLIWM